MQAPKARSNPTFRRGVVPDASTAIRIAEAVCIPIYGEQAVQHERPFDATLEDEVWTVTGSLPDGMLGGVAEVRISKQDGRILGVLHGQ